MGVADRRPPGSSRRTPTRPTPLPTRDSIRLAFVAALQHLQPKPRAVLLLRDVLGWHADEVADALDTTVTAVHSMLRRARRTMAERDTTRDNGATLGESEWKLVARYIDAFQRFDIDALVALLRDDAILSMPPIPGWLRGASCDRAVLARRRFGLSRLSHPANSANGLPAFGSYRPDPGGGYRALRDPGHRDRRRPHHRLARVPRASALPAVRTPRPPGRAAPRALRASCGSRFGNAASQLPGTALR